MTPSKISWTHRLEEVVDAAWAAEHEERQRNPNAPRHTGPELADRIRDSNPDLVKEMEWPCVRDRIVWVVKRRRGAWRDEHQLTLPGIDLPKTIPLRNGRRPHCYYCTAREMEQAIGVLRQQSRDRLTPKIRSLERALEIMRPYAEEEPDITWSAVVRKELERREFDRIVSA